MSDTEDTKSNIVSLLQSAKPLPSPRRRTTVSKAPTATGGNVFQFNGGHVSAQQIVAGDIHNHINTKTVVRPKIVRGPEFISPSGARKIKARIDSLVEMDLAAGEESKPRLYKKWWGILNQHFDVASYLEIRADQEQQALDWLQTLKVLKRPSIRRTNNTMWRKELYAGIWARAREANKSKADVYQVVLQKLGKQVISLTKLGERDLKALHEYIMNNW